MSKPDEIDNAAALTETSEIIQPEGSPPIQIDLGGADE